MNKERIEDITFGCVKRLLMPVARFCLRHAFTFSDFELLAQNCFMMAAQEQLQERQEKINSMRLSAVSGLNRKLTARFLRSGGDNRVEPNNVYAKIITLWREDPEYHNSRGAPRPLTVRGPDNEFSKLVRRVNEDLSVTSILNHLLHTASVREDGSQVVLEKGSYDANQDCLETFSMLGFDIEDLLCGVEENVFETQDIQNLHLTTEADEIAVADVPELKAWILAEGKRFHQRLRQELVKYDTSIANRGVTDGNPEPTARVTVGCFSRVKLPPEVGTHQDKNNAKS